MNNDLFFRSIQKHIIARIRTRNDGSTESVHNRNQQTLNWPKAKP